MKLLATLCIFLSTIAYPAWSDEMSPFLGSWTINVDKTMENLKTSPTYNKAEDEEFKETITSMMNAMRIDITADKVIYHMGQKQEPIALGKKTVNASSVIAEINNGGTKATLTFISVDKKYLNMKSSASHDMDYIIWEKSAAKTSQTTELDVISNAVKESGARKK